MRELTNFTQRGGNLVYVSDSITGRHSMASWEGDAKRLWVRPSYIQNHPKLGNPLQVFELDEGEQPEPKEGWAFAVGFFG